MTLSGTSVAVPIIAETIALMLQAIPSLTPTIIKAILQYIARSITTADLLQQGADLLNAAPLRLALTLYYRRDWHDAG